LQLFAIWQDVCRGHGKLEVAMLSVVDPASLDLVVSHAVARLNGHWPLFDAFVLALSANALLKGGVTCALLWWAWCARERQGNQHDRQLILAVLASCGLGEVIARLMSKGLPFRPRPLLNPDLPFQLPGGKTVEMLGITHESSFPSDHGVLFFALATGIWLVSRRAGVMAFAWALVMIALPRLYLGLHYASDLLAGAAIGIMVALVGGRLLPRLAPVRWAADWASRQPALFYPMFFVAMLELATMLVDVRALAVLARQA
jgi:undecaprenyl-diphosphatase